MTKIDKRKSYKIVLDVETAGDMEKPLVYDLGFVVADKQGNIYEKYSFIIDEIFCQDGLMKSAYYSEKIPQYLENLENGTMVKVSFLHAKKVLFSLIREYGIRELFAYNASFDFYKALNATQEHLTGRKYFFTWEQNKAVRINCIWSMASTTIFQQKTFPKWAVENGFYNPKTKNIQTSAEVAYSWLTKNESFSEKHTGLEDVLIETKIMAWCFKQHKKMNRKVDRLAWRKVQTFHKEEIAQLLG